MLPILSPSSLTFKIFFLAFRRGIEESDYFHLALKIASKIFSNFINSRSAQISKNSPKSQTNWANIGSTSGVFSWNCVGAPKSIKTTRFFLFVFLRALSNSYNFSAIWEKLQRAELERSTCELVLRETLSEPQVLFYSALTVGYVGRRRKPQALKEIIIRKRSLIRKLLLEEKK